MKTTLSILTSTLLIALFFSTVVFAQTDEGDSTALVTFYERTNGDNWSNNQGWLTAEVSEWYGITVDEEGRVTMMQLSNNQLSGELGDLRDVLPITLVEIDLSNNNLEGSFDAWNPYLYDLEIIRINNNQLSSAGRPETFNQMKKLRIFNAADNQLSHEFPHFTYNKQIEEINLSNNQLGGAIPDFKHHTKLKRLYIDNNYFSNVYREIHSFPQGFSLPAHIEEASLENNRFNFEDIGVLIRDLSLSETQVSYAPQKPFPLNLDIYKQLYISCKNEAYKNTAKFYRNGFLYDEVTNRCGIWLNESGSYQVKVTHEILTNPAVLSQNLTLESNTLNIDLNNPRIIDSVTLVNIYQTMGGENWHESYTNTWLQTPLEEWEGVNMHHDGSGVKGIELTEAWTEIRAPMVGSLPELNFNNIQNISFRDNSITGTLPKLPESLVNIRANNNHLEGNLEVFNEMPNLEVIFLSVNQFHSVLPTLEGSPKVEAILLDHTKVVDGIPKEWSALKSLKNLHLRGCKLSGAIALNELSQLENIDLNSNQFTNLETDFTQFPKLENVDIIRNYLTFEGLEKNAILPDSILKYGSQNNLPLNYDASTGKLFVSVGGTPTNNTFTWYKNYEVVAQNVGDSTLAITEGGRYNVEVTNSLITKDSTIAVAGTKEQHLILNARADVDPSDCLTQDLLTLEMLANNTDINAWNNGADTTWFTNKPMDEWAGITMSEDGCSVKSLSLREAGLEGVLPYLNFSDLRYLDVWRNPNLQGFLAIENITSLETLIVDDTNFLGGLPEFSSFPNLKEFSAVGCQFSGEIPAFTGLVNLENFSLHCPNITGSLPTFENARKILRLSITGTQITGEIPFLGYMELIQWLNLSNNQLNGTLPNLAIFDGLNYIDISANHFNFGDLRENVLNLKDKNIDTWKYAPQNRIEIHCSEQMLYVDNIGGNEEENTYTWTLEIFNGLGVLEDQPIGGDSSFLTVENGGGHTVQVTNSIVTNPNNPDQNLVLIDHYLVKQVENFCKECPIKANFLDLPNEAVLCDGGSITFDAPEGMTSYIWDFNDVLFSEESSVDITSEGWLHLAVLDSCGNADIDSVFVRLGNDLECGCVGDDCVWPGAINKDGVVNHYDLMGIGFAYEQTGASRSNASLNFEGQAAEDWGGSFAETMEGFEGRNHKHADCDGNGVVNRDDVVGIKKNYQRIKGKTGTGLSKIQSGGTPLYIESTEPTHLGGDRWQYDFTLHLGNDNQSASGVYFLALSTHIVMEDAEGDVERQQVPKVMYDDSWLGTLNANMITLDTFFMGENRFDIAITKTDQLGESGQGMVARISDVIEVGPLQKTENAEPPKVKLLISDIALLSKDGKVQDVDLNPDTSTGVLTPTELPLKIGVYPNPTSDVATVVFAQTPLAFQQLPNTLQLTLSNTIGQTVWQGNWTKQQETLALELRHLPEGLYFLKAQGIEGTQQYIGNNKIMVKH